MTASSWIDEAPATGFGSEALPYGVFEDAPGRARVGVRLGDRVLDAPALAAELAPRLRPVLERPSLNPLMAAGRATWRELRERLTGWVENRRARDLVVRHAHELATVSLLAPFEVGDYVDFFSSRHHAENAGRIFRPDQPPLRPNWLHLPMGYHGRAGTVVPSGTPVRRPWGQRRGGGPGGVPELAPTGQLDIEAEVGFVVGVPSRLGEPVVLDAFEDHVFGVVLVNDWSARDIQAWEAVPLGPFLGKSFATSISSWVLPLDALAAARVELPPREVTPQPYLVGPGAFGLDLTLEIRVNDTLLSRPRFSELYFSPAQQLAHLTVNGASVRPGDLFASGTVSGPEPGELGSLLELSWGGQRPFRLDDGTARTYLEDGDEVVIAGTAPARSGGRIALGEVRGTVLAAIDAPHER